MMAPDAGGSATQDLVLTIDLGAIVANWKMLAAAAAPARVAAVVKADAYGLGMARVAPALWQAGARRFFTASQAEGLALRALLPEAEIAVLHGLATGPAMLHVAAGLIPVLNSLDEIAAWRREAPGLPSMIHLDTGMNRLGLGPEEQAQLLAEPGRLDDMNLAGIVSHLACPDTPDHPMNAAQLADFRALLARLPRAPASLANSAGLFLGPEFRFDLVRAGMALYGLNPTPAGQNPMRPVVRLEARILQLRAIDSGRTVGYGAAHRSQGPGKIATIAIGYADGLLRSTGGRGQVFWQGRPIAMVGRVSMDLVTLDVTDLGPAAPRPGQFVEIIGQHQSADQLAASAGTIGYEILTGLSRRAERHYLPAEGTAP